MVLRLLSPQVGSDAVAQRGAVSCGPLLALLLENGETLAPMGAPNTVLFWARTPGQSRIDVVTGDPFRNPVTRELDIVVEV